MTLTPSRFPTDTPLPWPELCRYTIESTYYTLWAYRDFARADRTFLLRLLERGIAIENIYDVGASNGAWGLLVTRRLPGVTNIMFEPLVGHAQGYSRRMRGLLQTHPTWRLLPCALSDRVGEATIFMDANVFGSTLIPSPYAVAQWAQIVVPVQTIDTLLAAGTVPAPDVIKIDTQGSELAILKGAEAALPQTKALLLETWLSRGYGPETPLLTELIPWLAERSFVPVEVGDGYRSPDGLLKSVDAYFLRKDLAIELGYAL